MKKLFDYLVKEVSLVDEGAVNEKFILLKDKGGNVMATLLDKINKLEVDSEKIKEMTALFNLGEDEKSVLEGFMRFYKLDKSEGLLKAMRTVAKEDLPKEEPPKEEPPAEPSEETKQAIAKEKEKQTEIEKERDKVRIEKEKIEKELKELKDREEKSLFLVKAKEFKKLSVNPEMLADVLRVSKNTLPDEIYKELERVLKSADAAIELSKSIGDIYKEIGTSKDGGNPKGELENLIAEKMKDGKVTRAKAIVKIMEERPDMINVINQKGE